MGVCGQSYAVTPLRSIRWGGGMEVLLVGNTDFITKQWIQHSFPRDHVVIAEREGTVDGNDRLRIVNMSDANTLAETLTTYEFDRIVFFSEASPREVSVTAISDIFADCCTPYVTDPRKC